MDEQQRNDAPKAEVKNKGRINFGNKYVLLITKTAVLIAVTLLLQFVGHYAFPGVGGSIFVGTLVNLCLYVSAVSVGLVGSIAVAFLTPLVAFLTGHMGFPPLIPFIGLANYVLIFTVYFMLKVKLRNKWIVLVAAILAASVLKFVAMYFGVLNIASLLGAKPAQMQSFQIMFSWPQIVSALSGGAIAVPVMFGLKKARVI